MRKIDVEARIIPGLSIGGICLGDLWEDYPELKMQAILEKSIKFDSGYSHYYNFKNIIWLVTQFQEDGKQIIVNLNAGSGYPGSFLENFMIGRTTVKELSDLHYSLVEDLEEDPFTYYIKNPDGNIIDGISLYFDYNSNSSPFAWSKGIKKFDRVYIYNPSIGESF